MFFTYNEHEVMDVLTGPKRRRRWLPDENLAMMRKSNESGKTFSMVARRDVVSSNQLFHGRQMHQDGRPSAVSGGEEVVPASELSYGLKQIRELQRMLGKMTMENEILREPVEVATPRKWMRARPHCLGPSSSEAGLGRSRCSVLKCGK